MSRWLILLLSSLPMLAMAAEPQPLGRLFLTPAERAALDIVRQNNRPPDKIVTPGETNEDDEAVDVGVAAAPPPVVTVHGYVKRTDGKGTVWVNGQPVQEKSAIKDIEVGRMQGNTNQVQIKLPRTGQTIRLKAGQSYDPASGKMVDSLRDLPQHKQEAASAMREPEKDKESTAPEPTNVSADEKPSPTPPPVPSH